MNRFVAFGVRQLFAGFRRGQPIVVAFGLLVAIVGRLRHLSKRESLLMSRTLEPGEQIKIRFVRGDGVEEPTVGG